MRHKLRLFSLVLVAVFIFSFTVSCSTIAGFKNVFNEGINTTIPETAAAVTTIPETTASETIDQVIETTSITTTTTAIETTTAPKEAITIKLEIYEGPTYSPADNVCYYRIKANVTGNPVPTVVFSKDDSGGVWGADRVQINIYAGESYNLIAVAKSSAGTASDSILLTWGCDETPETTTQTTIEEKTAAENTVTVVTTQSKDPKIVGSEAYYNLIAQALNILAQKDPEVYKQYASVDRIEESPLDKGGGYYSGRNVYIDLVNQGYGRESDVTIRIALSLSHEFNHVVNSPNYSKLGQVEFEKAACIQQLNTAINIGAPNYLVVWLQNIIINIYDPQTWWWDTSTSTNG